MYIKNLNIQKKNARRVLNVGDYMKQKRNTLWNKCVGNYAFIVERKVTRGLDVTKILKDPVCVNNVHAFMTQKQVSHENSHVLKSVYFATKRVIRGSSASKIQ